MNPSTIPTLLLLCAFLACSGTIRSAPASSDLAAKEYVQKVSDIVSSMWVRELERNNDMPVPGTVELTFRITPDGKIEDLKVVSNTSSETVANIGIYVVTKAQLPPIPADALRGRSPWLNVHLPLTVNPPRMRN